jgi:FkbM family methyltransferase
MHLKHYIRVILRILSTSYRYGKVSVLYCYVRLVIKSFAHHRLSFRKREQRSKVLEENVMGFTIRFFTHAQLIDLFEEILIFQVYDHTNADPKPLIIDCGSNIGISVLYFKKIYPAARIIAFEPDQETFAVLEENIRRNNLSDVTLFNVALQDNEGEMILYKKHHTPGSLTMSLIGSSANLETTTIQSRKLSDYIHETVTMIKIDVEGSEVNIVADLIQNQKIRRVEKMIIEYHPSITKLPTKEFISMIEQYNFSCHYTKDQLHPNATEVLVYCINKTA